MPQRPVIIENDAGDRLQLVDGRWQPIGNSRAAGASYLPGYSRGDPDKSEAAYYREYKKKDDDAVASAYKGVSTARRAERLLDRQPTGGIFSVPVLGGLAGMLDPEIRELDSIQAEAARSKRQPGEGAISDYDAQQFLSMTYGKDKPTATNRALIQAQRVADDAVIQRRSFMDWYVSSYGTTNGAPEAWSRYSQDNPIFDQNAGGATPVLNGKRQQWREYFGAVRTAGDRRPTDAADDAARAAVGRSVDQPIDLSKGGSRKNIPKGAYYRDPFGFIRRNDNGDAGNPIIRRPNAAGGGGGARSMSDADLKKALGL